MDKREFLKQLKKALENDLQESIVQENLSYYENYIDEEVRNGSLETDVVAGLGDPWVIARTVIETEKRSGHASEYSFAEPEERRRTENTGSTGSDNIDKKLKLKMILTLVAIVLVFFLIVALVMGVISALLPFLIPVLIIIFVLKKIDPGR